MKKVICIILFVVISLFSYVSVAEGLLPSLSETVGIAMPSLGEALQRYPDSESENDDGSVTELYTNVSEADFNTFSVYLKKQGAKLADYKVEGSILTAEIKAKGASFSLSYDNKSGEAIVIYPKGTYDERIKNAKAHFDAGQKLLKEGKADEALTEILAIPQYCKYAPVEELFQDNASFASAVDATHETKLAPYRMIGNIVTFGHYEQDNNTANGPEEIEWIVLDYDEKEHKALLLSRYGLDVICYNTKSVDMTWEKCTLRRRLNGSFLRSAFTTDEQAAIMTTAVDNSFSQGYSKWDTDGGNNTQDQIFLLSYTEANRYLGVTDGQETNTRAVVAPTVYAIANGAWNFDDYQTVDGEAGGWWFLRSPGENQHCAAIVGIDGSLSHFSVDHNKGVVRPAFWLNLESDIF